MASITKLKGMVALVTGGASGLGWGTVERFVQQGAKVVVCDLVTSRGEEVVKALGSEAVFVPTNVTSEEDVTTALNTAKKTFGRLDVTVNCAGTSVATMTYSARQEKVHSLDDFKKVVEVNLIGTFNVGRLSAQMMAQNEPNQDKQRGLIINTSSIAAFEGQKGQIAYTASKGGIWSMGLCMARELAHVGIRVNTIAPGFFDTPLFNSIPDKARTQLLTMFPFPGRIGVPDEFAHLAQSIVENPLINGECIRIDNALRMA